MTASHLEPEQPPSGPHSGPQGASAADSGGREGRVGQRAREGPLGASVDSPGSNWPAVLAALAAAVRAALKATQEDFALCPPPPVMETTMPDQPAPDPLAPFRALADQYAAKAAESTRNAEAIPLTIRTANQGIAAGWRSAEFLLRHTLNSLDNRRTTPNNPPTSAFPEVQGRCPACHRESLFVGSGGYITCSQSECPEPDAASTLLERGPDNAADEAAAGAHGRQPTPPEPTSENAAAHFILTTICERNGYRPPQPGIQITADDLARIDRMVEDGTPFGEAVSDVIGLAAWQAQQADTVLDQRVNDARTPPEESPPCP